MEKRRQYGVQAEQTFPLPASVAPEEMTELLRVLREITGSTRIELDSHSRSITHARLARTHRLGAAR